MFPTRMHSGWLVPIALLGVAAAGILAASVTSRSPRVNQSHGEAEAPPQTLTAQVAYRDLILIATVSGFLRTEQVLLNTPDPQYAVDDELNQPRHAPWTYYGIEPRDVLLDVFDHGSNPVEWMVEGDPHVFVGSSGWVPDDNTEWLFFMRRDFEGTDNYLTDWGQWDAFDLGGEEVRYANGELVPYAADMTSTEFLTAVRQEIATLYHYGTPTP